MALCVCVCVCVRAVVGCADVTSSDEMWSVRNENEVEIGCRSTDQRWHLICVDNEWEGTLGNCSTRELRETNLLYVGSSNNFSNQIHIFDN